MDNIYTERKVYNNTISVKLLIPGGCNANCVFCYMKDYGGVLKNNKTAFLSNFIESLNYIINKVGNKNPISIDITGNEPTYDVEFLRAVLIKLKQYDIRHKVSRVTMTTNGYNLEKLIPYLDGVVDYINISVHDYRKEERNDVFRFRDNNYIHEKDYSRVTKELLNIGITCSAVAVLYKEINNFKEWMDGFIKWCKNNGFVSLRFRYNVFWKDGSSIFDRYMEQALSDSKNFQIITHENTNDSHWCRLRMNDKFRVFFLHGVLNTTEYTKGIEYVIHDDGKCYTDFYKKTPIEEYKYEIGKIYDKII